jgi:hypothetical protein
MAERRRRVFRWLLVRLLIFAAGVAAGYYLRDRQQDDFKSMYEQTVAELEDLKEAGEEVIDRAHEAGENLKAAAESTRAAVEEIRGGEGN